MTFKEGTISVSNVVNYTRGGYILQYIDKQMKEKVDEISYDFAFHPSSMDRQIASVFIEVLKKAEAIKQGKNKDLEYMFNFIQIFLIKDRKWRQIHHRY
jgi:hypothetical protein